jgi:hypothetical protein
MKIVIVSIGTRGDVQPSVLLGLTLRKRGHDVIIATEERLRPLVEEIMGPSSDDGVINTADGAGVEVTPPSSSSSSSYWRLIEGDETGIMNQPHVQEYLANGNLIKIVKATNEWKKKFDEQSILKSYKIALADADIVIASGLCLTKAMCVAESIGAGFVTLVPGPTLPTCEFNLWVLPIPCKCLYKWSYHFLYNTLWKQEKKSINTFRTKELNLPPMTAGPMSNFDKYGFPVLIAASTVTCGPKMTVPLDYPPYAIVDGFIFPPSSDDDNVLLDNRLVNFVENKNYGERPIIYLGWGSMPAPDPIKMIQLARELCDAASCRGILVAGWSSLLDPNHEQYIQTAQEGDVLLIIQSVSHSWLLPKCAALIHHCGIGTCAAALRAGVPQIASPVMVDQPHNAKMLQRLGVLGGIVPFGKKMTVKTLLPPLMKILDEKGNGPLCQTARAVSEKIIKESEGNLERYANAVESAVKFPMPS